MKQSQHTPVVLKNNRTKEITRGVVIDEERIDDKAYWVVIVDNRPSSKLRFAKDAWSIQKGKV